MEFASVIWMEETISMILHVVRMVGNLQKSVSVVTVAYIFKKSSKISFNDIGNPFQQYV